MKRKFDLRAGIAQASSLLTAFLLVGGSAAIAGTGETTVYIGGPILTMAGDQPEWVEAVAVRDGLIVATGAGKEVERAVGRKAVRVDLKGHAMLPGFIDAHGHVGSTGRQSTMANLAPPPVGDVTSIAGLQDKLRTFMRQHPVGLIPARGYDDAELQERRHPTRHDLDVVSTERPIAIVHTSGHLAVANSALLAQLGIGPDTPDPSGGKIWREQDGRTPSGVLEEAAADGLRQAMSPTDPESSVTAIIEGLREFAAHGITTAQDAGVLPQQWPAYLAASKRGLPIDLVVLAAGVPNLPEQMSKTIGTGYQGGLRIAGIKLGIDGSPQGRTAWLGAPYHQPPEDKPADYRGYPRTKLTDFEHSLANAARNGWQVFVHVNGDAALDALIDGVRKSGLAGRRTIALHNQVIRPEQLEMMRELDIQPSFFANHTYFWGDWHREVILGGRRADFISPQASAWRAGLRPTTHNDSPVVPPDIMRLIWSSATRRTRTGDILGPDERIPVYRALQQVTINAAWQLHEDGDKGSIEKGKQADFVILQADPLKVDPEELWKILVVATINDGVVVAGSLDVLMREPGRAE